VCAAAYPSLSQLFSAAVVSVNGSAAANGMALWISVTGSLLLALGVMAVSFRAARSVADVRARFAAHLAFATPSFFVGFGNVANLWHAPLAALIAWPLFWAAIAVTVLSPQSGSAPLSRISAEGYRRLGMAHG